MMRFVCVPLLLLATSASSLVKVTKWNVDELMRTKNCVILSFCADWKKSCAAHEDEMAKAAKLADEDPDFGKDIVFATADLSRTKSLGRQFNVTKIPHIYKFMTFDAMTEKDGKKNLGVSYESFMGKYEAKDIYRYAKVYMEANRRVEPMLELEKELGKLSPDEYDAQNPLNEAFDELTFHQQISEPYTHGKTVDTLVYFWRPNNRHCKRLDPEFAWVAAMYNQTGSEKFVNFVTLPFDEDSGVRHLVGQGDAKLGAAVEQDGEEKYDWVPHIKGFPTLVLFPANGKKPVVHQRFPDTASIISFINEHASSAFKKTIDDATAEKAAADYKTREQEMKRFEKEYIELNGNSKTSTNTGESVDATTGETKTDNTEEFDI